MHNAYQIQEQQLIKVVLIGAKSRNRQFAIFVPDNTGRSEEALSSNLMYF